jgi:hypothetical protein
MPLPLIPIAIAALGLGAWHAVKKKEAPVKVGAEGGLTPDRAILYETALRTTKDSDKLRTLAQAFRSEGLTPQAEMLEKRARLRDLPPDVKLARRAAFKKGMASTNPQAIIALADVFDCEGATGAADALRTYASGLGR